MKCPVCGYYIRCPRCEGGVCPNCGADLPLDHCNTDTQPIVCAVRTIAVEQALYDSNAHRT